MISVRLFVVLFFVGMVGCIYGQEKYEVISTSKLNVRSRPTTKSSIIGKLEPNEKIGVYSIVNYWAKFSYNNQTAYISSKYIRKIEVEEDIPVVDEHQEKSEPIINTVEVRDTAETLYEIQKQNHNVAIDFVPIVYGGFANFVSDKSSPNGTIGFGLDLAFQFIANNSIRFIPKGYYMETSLGYALKGSNAFPLHYITVRLSPVGYRYKLSDFIFFGKIGVNVGHTFSAIETKSHSFDTYADFSILGDIGVEYKKIGFGVLYERGLTNVCNSELKLRNQCVCFRLSYRLFNLK
jgi:uncharacterized protein YraI